MWALGDRRNELPVRQVQTRVEVDGRPPILRAPVVERRTRDEGHVPDDVYGLCAEANHDALCGQRDPAALLHHDDAVTEIEPLVLKSVDCVLRFEHCPWWDVLHHRTLEIFRRQIFVKPIGKFFDLLNDSLRGSSASWLGSIARGWTNLVQLITHQRHWLEIAYAFAREPRANFFGLGTRVVLRREDCGGLCHIYAGLT